MTTRRKDILSRFMEEVWNKGQADSVDFFLAPQYTIHHDPGDPWHGATLDIEGFKERLKVSRAPFPDQRFDLDTLIEDGNKIATSWHWSGTQMGPVAGIPASGKRILMSGLTIYYFDDDDRLCGHWQVIDRLGVFQQLTAA